MNRDRPDLGGQTAEGRAGRLEGEQAAQEAGRHLACGYRDGWSWERQSSAVAGNGHARGGHPEGLR